MGAPPSFALVQLKLKLRQVAYQGGYAFLGLLHKPVRSDHFAFVHPRGFVGSCSAGFASLFSLTLDAIRDEQVVLDSMSCYVSALIAIKQIPCCLIANR